MIISDPSSLRVTIYKSNFWVECPSLHHQWTARPWVGCTLYYVCQKSFFFLVLVFNASFNSQCDLQKCGRQEGYNHNHWLCKVDTNLTRILSFLSFLFIAEHPFYRYTQEARGIRGGGVKQDPKENYKNTC